MSLNSLNLSSLSENKLKKKKNQRKPYDERNENENSGDLSLAIWWDMWLDTYLQIVEEKH